MKIVSFGAMEYIFTSLHIWLFIHMSVQKAQV